MVGFFFSFTFWLTVILGTLLRLGRFGNPDRDGREGAESGGGMLIVGPKAGRGGKDSK